MKQVPDSEGLTPNDRDRLFHSLEALIPALMLVVRARKRGEPGWMIDVRRAQSRLDALRAAARARRAQPGSQAGEP